MNRADSPQLWMEEEEAADSTVFTALTADLEKHSGPDLA